MRLIQFIDGPMMSDHQAQWPAELDWPEHLWALKLDDNKVALSRVHNDDMWHYVFVEGPAGVPMDKWADMATHEHIGLTAKYQYEP